MKPEIIQCEQGSPEWYSARAGLPTASEFKTIIGVKKDAREKKTRDTYMLKLAGEILTGEPMEKYTNDDMERGHALEDEARNLYAMLTGADLTRVGFIRFGNTGASPDSLIGNDGGLEIKTAAAHIQIDRLRRDAMPPEHVAQVQGNLWVSGREWWDFASYCSPKLPLFRTRVYRDNAYIANIAGEVDRFNDELAELVAFIRRYEMKEAA